MLISCINCKLYKSNEIPMDEPNLETVCRRYCITLAIGATHSLVILTIFNLDELQC